MKTLGRHENTDVQNILCDKRQTLPFLRIFTSHHIESRLILWMNCESSHSMSTCGSILLTVFLMKQCSSPASWKRKCCRLLLMFYWFYTLLSLARLMNTQDPYQIWGAYLTERYLLRGLLIKRFSLIHSATLSLLVRCIIISHLAKCRDRISQKQRCPKRI